MNKGEEFNLTYVTIDSLAEGVGSSQITPLIAKLSKSGLKIHLISYEKLKPETDLVTFFESLGVSWNFQTFGAKGLVGGIKRFNSLRQLIHNTNLIHARSDIPAVSAIASREAPVLWDVRSLWADQKIMTRDNLVHKSLYQTYRSLESLAASNSLGMSTLTSTVVPVLEERHNRLPHLRTVVPTAVDLDRFQLKLQFPNSIKALFSGTYNDYYDLDLSARFLGELQKLVEVEIQWARPTESSKFSLGVGEEKIFPATQTGMAEIIPHFSFGVSICKLDAGPSLKAAMPTKIAEFLACGRPIVVSKGLGDMDTFVEKFNIGVVLDGSKENLNKGATSLMNILSDPETPVRCRAVAENFFNLEIGVKKYLDIYAQMLRVSE
jgi:glycosyltransferase involved in cell wall biosynthesis